MRALVTGGAGFIGSHVVDLLLAEGHSVTVVDNFSTGRGSNLPDHPFLTVVNEDIRQYSVTGSVDFDVIFHLAAVADVQKSWEYPFEVEEVNTDATIRLAVRARDTRFIFSSTSAVYHWPSSEDGEAEGHTVPSTPYGVGKLIAEYSLLKLGAVALRYFNVFGPRQLMRGGYPAVVPTFIQSALRDDMLVLDGGGTQERDFVYVGEVAKANLAALARFESFRGTPLNVGTGIGIPIEALARLIKDETRSKSEVLVGPVRRGDVFRAVAPQHGLKWGWTNQTSTRDAMRTTIEWWKKEPM